MCGRYIILTEAPCRHPAMKKVTADPTLLNLKNDIFPLIKNIIIPKVLTLLYLVQPKMLAVIYWNLYVVETWYIEKLIDVSELHKSKCCSVGPHICKTILFHS